VVVFKEMRRQDGKSYPMSAMNYLLSGLKWYMVEKNPGAPNFIGEKDVHFSGFYWIDPGCSGWVDSDYSSYSVTDGHPAHPYTYRCSPMF